MFCKSCGSHMDDSFNVCQNCGTKKGEGSAFCDKCGAIRQAGMAFCQECGSKFDAPQAVPAAPVVNTAPQSVASMNQSNYLPPKKFCRNCGKQVMNSQAICTACGVKVGDGKSFCPHCGASVQNPEQIACTSCGMSLKKNFDANGYFGKFADNFTKLFRTGTDIKVTLLDYGSMLLSFVIFILCLLPSITISVTVLGYKESSSISVFSISGFAGTLIVLALLVSIARFVPHVDDFINNNPTIGRFYVLAVPALTLIGLGVVVIAVLRYGAAAAVTSWSYSYADVYCGFNVLGWILIIFAVASIGAGVLSFLRKEGKINLGF